MEIKAVNRVTNKTVIGLLHVSENMVQAACSDVRGNF
jgi:hypothetical protein